MGNILSTFIFWFYFNLQHILGIFTHKKKAQICVYWNVKIESRISEFTKHIRTKCTPSGIEIRKAQEKYPCLKYLLIAVIKTKVNNIILGKCNVGLIK